MDAVATEGMVNEVFCYMCSMEMGNTFLGNAQNQVRISLHLEKKKRNLGQKKPFSIPNLQKIAIFTY